VLVVWMISGAWLLIVGVSPRSSEREDADWEALLDIPEASASMRRSNVWGPDDRWRPRWRSSALPLCS